MRNVNFISFNSDKNSPCCQGCAYMTAGVKCRDAQYATCEQESRCTGASSECPRSPAMKDSTSCLERGQCRGGKCVPYCETQNLQSCMCDTSTYFILISKYCRNHKWQENFIMFMYTCIILSSRKKKLEFISYNLVLQICNLFTDSLLLCAI